MRVLCVDDSEFVRKSLRTTLDTQGYEVAIASDAQEAFALVQNASFDIIITDVNMPVISGLDMIAQMQAESILDATTKIVMLTTETNPELKVRGKALGVDVWMIKPYQEKSLMNVIRKLSATK